MREVIFLRTLSVALVLLVLVGGVIGCTTLSSSQPTITSVIPTKQPEPSRPLVEGEISGVPDGTLVTMHVRTPEDREAHTVKGPFPGSWEAVVTEASGLDYIVTAEAEGYVSQPISYTIHISGDTAYVVCDGKVTDEEAVHLDFDFEPRDSP